MTRRWDPLCCVQGRRDISAESPTSLTNEPIPPPPPEAPPKKSTGSPRLVCRNLRSEHVCAAAAAAEGFRGEAAGAAALRGAAASVGPASLCILNINQQMFPGSGWHPVHADDGWSTNWAGAALAYSSSLRFIQICTDDLYLKRFLLLIVIHF